MSREYWKLFWTTGMPEAWLMSRDGEETPPLEADQDGIQGLTSPLADSPYPVSSSIPGNRRNIY